MVGQRRPLKLSDFNPQGVPFVKCGRTEDVISSNLFDLPTDFGLRGGCGSQLSRCQRPVKSPIPRKPFSLPDSLQATGSETNQNRLYIAGQFLKKEWPEPASFFSSQMSPEPLFPLFHHG